MKKPHTYLMESPQEAKRLEIKTDPEKVKEQALWFGIGPGKRVLDVGCGSGKVSSVLHELVQPDGYVLGIDFSEDRIVHARERFGDADGLDFQVVNFTEPLDMLDEFDYVWVRFVLEYFRKDAASLIENLTTCLTSNGHLCLIDLDHNCSGHYPLPNKMENILHRLIHRMSEEYNFDPFVGRKLYTYLFDLQFRDIQLNMTAHHLIYGELRFQDHFNWMKKIEMAGSKADDIFNNYPGGYDSFFEDFESFFSDPRRFTYTPLIMCKGKKPLHVKPSL